VHQDTKKIAEKLTMQHIAVNEKAMWKKITSRGCWVATGFTFWGAAVPRGTGLDGENVNLAKMKRLGYQTLSHPCKHKLESSLCRAIWMMATRLAEYPGNHLDVTATD